MDRVTILFFWSHMTIGDIVSYFPLNVHFVVYVNISNSLYPEPVFVFS